MDTFTQPCQHPPVRLSDQPHRYRLVQDGFARLGYPRLEEACERDGGFVRVREPDSREAVRIGLLESLVEQVLPGFFGEGPLPPCRVITSERGVLRVQVAGRVTRTPASDIVWA